MHSDIVGGAHSWIKQTSKKQQNKWELEEWLGEISEFKGQQVNTQWTYSQKIGIDRKDGQSEKRDPAN